MVGSIINVTSRDVCSGEKWQIIAKGYPIDNETIISEITILRVKPQSELDGWKMSNDLYQMSKIIFCPKFV